MSTFISLSLDLKMFKLVQNTDELNNYALYWPKQGQKHMTDCVTKTTGRESKC